MADTTQAHHDGEAGPFRGSYLPGRVSLGTRRGGTSLPFPHPWNYTEPLRILERYYAGTDGMQGSERHSRYLHVPGFKPILVTRDPAMIRAISAETGAKAGQFDRDTMPSRGIARATGEDTLLYANGEAWKRQKKLAMPPFARATLFQPERFHDFEVTFRQTVRERLGVFASRITEAGSPLRVQLEPEVKAVMLEMLVNCFFGAEVEYGVIRDRFVPALDTVIDHIVRDTVFARFGIPLRALPWMAPRMREVRRAQDAFEELTDIVLEPRRARRGLWSQFESDAPDDALRGNIRVFLAGALEATTSYASWAISHAARDAECQGRVFAEVRQIDAYTPETLDAATNLKCLLDETLRLTPSLYFHPRLATEDTWVEVRDGERIMIPKGTHILLDVWHANRHDDHWGPGMTGFPAREFRAERWKRLASEGKGRNDALHFGFGHGPRFCPGKSLGQLEVALVVGTCIKLFDVRAVNEHNEARAGVSTKPEDGVLVDLTLRGQDSGLGASVAQDPPAAPACPFHSN
ncbi:MAG: cytochrome P450 [Planctomycetota bacterium]